MYTSGFKKTFSMPPSLKLLENCKAVSEEQKMRTWDTIQLEFFRTFAFCAQLVSIYRSMPVNLSELEMTPKFSSGRFHKHYYTSSSNLLVQKMIFAKKNSRSQSYMRSEVTTPAQ
jgi:hypothetical protein